MYKSIRFICLYALLLLSCHSHSQAQIIDQEGMNKLFHTYGYLIGQEEMLQNIERKFPQLANEVSRARLTFSGRFGKATREVKYFVETNAPKEVMQQVSTQIKQNINPNTLTLSNANDFITEVKNRGQSILIESPVFETLLFFQFFEQPEKEISQNYVRIYNTKGHPKAKRTDWQIKVPYSWTQKEGDRPNIIQKFIRDEDSNNSAQIMLMVKDLPSDAPATLSSSDWDELLAADTYNSKNASTGGETKFIYSQKMVFDGLAGGLVYFEIKTPRLDQIFYSGMYQFMFYYKKQLYTLQGTVISNNKSSQVKLAAKYKSLFFLVANSIVVNAQYKK